MSDSNLPDEISIEQIRAIACDEEGVLWLGTYGKSLTAFDPAQNKFKAFPTQPIEPRIPNYDRIISLMTDEGGDLWIGTQGNGLLIMNRRTGIINKRFRAKAPSRDESIPDNTICCMMKANRNQAWVAVRNAGLLLIDKQQGILEQHIFKPGKNQEFIDNNLQSFIKINDSTLALGYERNGIKLLHNPSGTFTPVSNELIENTLNKETAVKCLFYSQGWLWAGTAGKGILITHLQTGNSISLTEQEGLPNNMIYGILPENDQAVWVSSNKGLFRIEYEDRLQDFIVKEIRPYTVADGLQSNEFNTGAYHKSSDGILYFGGISGLNFFDPQEIKYAQNQVPVVLTAANVGNRPVENDTLITYRNKLNLSYEQNSISFNFTALDFVSPERFNYQYQLESYDEDWVDAADRRYTAYTNLRPGNYTFKARVSGSSIENAPQTSLAISIATPFWQRWWFIAGAFGALVLLLYSFYRYRINQLLQVQKVKNSISADLHDDIGSRLTNIQFLSALSRNKLQAGPATENFLNGIEEQVQASAEALDEIVWNIKMTDESLEDITAKMRRYAGEVLENDGLQYTVHVGAEFSRKKMSMQKRRELFLVFKELLNNIRKHAHAKKVAIHISIQNNKFYLAVKDDGRGFNPQEATDRNGLRILKERVERWKGSLEIQSAMKEGVLVELWIPFDRKII